MPQMAPLSWLILFFLFSFSFIIFNMLNYFCFFNKKQETYFNIKNNTSSFNWKW